MSPRASTIFVWLVWAATLASILIAIGRDGRNIPFEEDWLMVAPMVGQEPDIPRWLWSQNSEHRLPLPRLVNLAILRTTGDLRATMVFNALALAAVTAAMILVARSLRQGRTSMADAFFPLLLLHLGNWDNLVWAWQIQFVLPTVLACVLLLIVVARPDVPSRGTAVVGTLALVSLPLSGANGLLYAPTLAGWFAYTAWLSRQEAHPQRSLHGWVAAAAASVTILLCVGYFLGYEPSPWNDPSAGVRASLETAGKFLALSLGPAAAASWLLSGATALLILLMSVAALGVAGRIRDEEKVRIVGLLAFFAAITLLALAVGWGRAGRAAATGRMPTRYVLLAAPSMCAAYFTLLLFARGRVHRIGPAVLALLVALLFPLNTHVGLKRRQWFADGMVAFERDLAAGASSDLLARRHHSFLLHWDEALMARSIRMLHDARVGPFIHLREAKAAAQPRPLTR